MPARYRDIDGKMVLIRNEDAMYNMWVDDVHKESDNIGPQVDGQQGGIDNAGPESGIGPQADVPHDGTDNAGPEEGVTNENSVFESHEGPPTGETSTVQNKYISDDSDSTYSGESEESTDNGSDLGFFMDGDSLNDTRDPIIDGEDDQGFNPPNNIREYEEYAAMINEDYMEYVARRNRGQILDYGTVYDLEVLEEAHGSSDENDGLGFREFNKERDMQNPDIVVGLIFPNSTVHIAALRLFSIRNDFELKFIKNDPDKVIAKCLDACHLKGPYSGHLMHAIARDANNQMYLLAMAYAESECKDSWSWFLDILSNEIGSPLDRHWVFISDRQKGLVETFEKMFLGVEYRFCVRPLYVNFKLRFKDKILRDILFAATKAYLPDVHYRKNEFARISE
ncbi:hypothetical protein ACH5RR_037976 [Cinchona calisaya]|uniref:MULE transposase domain-containing protein n=1 Tax=Cinchona calisaya TaxID=153742 RepID=A0ABD2YAR4_9GENT